MKALRKLEPGVGNASLQEVPVPEAGFGQAVIEVKAAGICGTDIHILAGEYPTMPPVTIGHEIAGVVKAIGEAVDDGWLGSKVTSETYFSTCGKCRQCRAGLPNLCPDRRSIGTHVDGAFAEFVLVPAANLRRLPENVTVREGGLTEPLACVCHSLSGATRVSPGDRVMITGPGAIGLLAAQVARSAGGEVTVFGLPGDQPRLKLASGLGFETSTNAPVEEAFDVAIECSGAAGGLKACLDGARRAGGLIVIGLAGKEVTILFDRIAFKQLTVSSALATVPASWDQALALMAEGKVDLKPLISEVAPLESWERVFADARAARGVKFMFDPTLAGPG